MVVFAFGLKCKEAVFSAISEGFWNALSGASGGIVLFLGVVFFGGVALLVYDVFELFLELELTFHSCSCCSVVFCVFFVVLT